MALVYGEKVSCLLGQAYTRLLGMVEANQQTYVEAWNEFFGS